MTIDSNENITISNSNSADTVLTIDSQTANGNIGILKIAGDVAGGGLGAGEQSAKINFFQSAEHICTISSKRSEPDEGELSFQTRDASDSAPVERFIIKKDGHITHSSTGSIPTNEAVHHIVNNNNNVTLMVDSTKTSGFDKNTMKLQNSQDSSNSSYNQLEVRNGGGAVLRILDGGNVINSNNSYGQISDERVKQDIADASSQWDDIKALKVRKFKLKREVNKDSDSAAFQIGVIAQEVASSGMSGLVSEERPNEEDVALHSDFGTIDGKGVFTEGEKVKSIKYSVLYMKAIKALQEAMARIETLEAKVTTLENT